MMTAMATTGMPKQQKLLLQLHTGTRPLLSCIRHPVTPLSGHYRRRAQCSIVVQASASQEPASTPPLSKATAPSAWLPNAASLQLLGSGARLLKFHLWSIIIIFAAKDVMSFILYRFSHRLTNIVAESALGIPLTQLGANPWWLYLEPTFLEGSMVYQACIVAGFILFLPIAICIDAAAWAATASICVPNGVASVLPSGPPTSPREAAGAAPQKGASEGGAGTDGGPTEGGLGQSSGEADSLSASGEAAGTASGTGSTSDSASSGTDGANSATTGAVPEQSSTAKAAAVPPSVPPARGLVASIRRGFGEVFAVLPTVPPNLRRLWWVGVLFNVQALPLQALSLLVVPLFWTVPRLMDIQLALPVAALEGESSKAALDRSAKLMTPSLRSIYGWPFVMLIISLKLFDNVRTLALASIPTRFWTDVMEVPIALTLLFGGMKLLLIRLQDLLPLAAFLMAREQEQQQPLAP